MKRMQYALDLLFPPRCVVCQKSGRVLCLSCEATIRPLPAPFCARCSASLSPNTFCRRCRYQPLRISGLCAMGGYDEPLRTCIHALKYQGQTRLAEPLGALLARTCRDRGLTGDVIVPVPLHPERQRQRGYNQSQLLAEVCARALGIPLGANLLTRVRATQAQAQLAASERRSNVADAFACIAQIGAHLLTRRNVLLIDDVSTSGATLEACAASLFAAGAQAVWGVVLARPVQQNDRSYVEV